MKFWINKKDIQNLLKLCNSIIDASNSSPYIQGLYLEAKKDKLIVISTNGIISCKTFTFDIDVIEEGSILIKSRILYNVVQKLKNEKIYFEKIDNSILKIKTNYFDSNMVIMDETKFPTINFDISEIENIKLPSSIFNDVIHKIKHAVVQNREKISILNGVCFEMFNNTLSIIGTDSYKLSYISYNLNDQYDNFKIIIDSTLFSIIEPIINESEEIIMKIVNNNLLIKINNIYFSSKLINGEYPNVKSIISSSTNNHTIVKRKNILNALERGMILAMSERKPIVNIEFKEDSIITIFKSSDLGDSKEVIEIEKFSGIETKFMLNASYLLSLLKVVDNDEIKLSNSQDNKPIIITDDKNKNFIQLLLPLRNI